MIIGIIKPEGEAPELGKWYVGLEVLKYPPYTDYQGFALRPYFRFYCFKVLDLGTEHMGVNGRPYKKVGGWWQWTFPVGFCITRI